MKRFSFGFILVLAVFGSLSAQEAPAAPLWDASKFIVSNHLHQISGMTTLAIASATGIYGASLVTSIALPGGSDVHEALGHATVALGAITLALGLTAYADKLDKVWPHAALMGLAETGWLLNSFVLKPGSMEHQVTGAVSIAALYAGFASILLINDQ